jgi:integrase
MGRSSDADRRHLELHHGQWRVVVSVPRGLHKSLGTKLKEPLRTDSLAVANRLKWPIVAKLKALITERDDAGGRSAFMQEAAELARLRRLAQDDDEIEMMDIAIGMRADELAGDPVEVLQPHSGPEIHVMDPARERLAGLYTAIARGEATPLGQHHDAYMASLSVKPRTKADDVRALAFLRKWCSQNNVKETLEAITPKVAARFMDGLSDIAGGQSPVTLNKYLRRLARYWQWLVKRHYADANVWEGKTLEEPDEDESKKERDFTDTELLRLLRGETTPQMHDLMRIGALTGARLDAVVCLIVGDCRDDRFIFKAQKKEKGPRACPIHPALSEIIARRTANKADDDPLFPEWPGPKKADSVRERSFKASNQFTDYRRAVGVDDVVDGKRRSRVNFHSFRRWFVTRAERADQSEHIIAAVVGHKRNGITLSVYSSGPLFEQAKRCVEAVQLPTEESVKRKPLGLRDAAAREGKAA